MHRTRCRHQEYHKNPSSIGSRSYTQLARWKFREFNELPHVFQQRLYRSYPLAESYINQFPNDRTAQLARFVAFVAGSFASVLVLLSVLDPDAFLHFQVTQDRSVLFYLTVFGTILAVARGMVPDDHRVVDPEELMQAVIEETHHLPNEWRGKLHSAEVTRHLNLRCVLLPHIAEGDRFRRSTAHSASSSHSRLPPSFRKSCRSSRAP